MEYVDECHAIGFNSWGDYEKHPIIKMNAPNLLFYKIEIVEITDMEKEDYVLMQLVETDEYILIRQLLTEINLEKH